MKNNTITLIVIIVIIILGLWIYSANKSKNLNNSTVTPVSQNNPSPQLFANSPLSQNAYLISIPTYDAKTKAALSGFNVTSTVLPDGSTQYMLKAQNPGYQSQTYVVKTGEKLYFIDSQLSDDSGTTDTNPSDDTAIVVDVNGYIVNR